VGERDRTVEPSHSYKMAALMQQARTRGRVLLRVEEDAGHGWGPSRRDWIEHHADRWTFLFQELDH
jgi:prolyl oligopeptidase